MVIKQDYNTNDQSKFILTLIKWDYNTYDRLNFILTVIKQDYGMNDWSKLTLNKEKDHRWSKKEMKMHKII